LKIAIAGGTGFIGSHLVKYFTERDHHVILISRSRQSSHTNRISCIPWDRLDERLDDLERLDAIVNLAGESINQRWTKAAKQRILNSRLETTGAVARIVEKLHSKPKVVINGSGMSIYGTSETETFDETSSPHITDFLADVVKHWERAADQISDTRVVKLRIGIVLGKDGGALPKMMLPYRLYAGGKVGSGKQWLSWIHIDDMVRLVEYCITCQDISGPVNATAPNPVTNDQFGRAIARALRRPHLFPVPALVFKLLFGELSVLLLEGQRVLPEALLHNGFKFIYPTVDVAMKELTS
jgi:uncharacterized protein (TIGR01777 family)